MAILFTVIFLGFGASLNETKVQLGGLFVRTVRFPGPIFHCVLCANQIAPGRATMIGPPGIIARKKNDTSARRVGEGKSAIQ